VPRRSRTLRPLALSLVALGILARLVPHPPNFVPVGAVSLYSGARLRSWQAYLIPLLILAVTDPILGPIFGFRAFSALTPFVYLSFVISVWIGRHLRDTERVWRVGGATVLGSLQFFLVTNFGVWATGHWYPHTLAGLTECYFLAIPFFGLTLASDLAYVAVFFGIHAWLSRKYFPQELVETQLALS
jgi:hypothetical protein